MVCDSLSASFTGGNSLSASLTGDVLVTVCLTYWWCVIHCRMRHLLVVCDSLSSASLTGGGYLSFVSLTGGRYLSADPPSTIFQTVCCLVPSLSVYCNVMTLVKSLF